MSELFDLSGKTAFVTGAAGILGQGFSRVLAKHGAKVAMIDLDSSDLDSIAHEIVTENKDADLLPIQCDVTDGSEVADAVSKTIQQFGMIDVLLSNAASKSDDLKGFFASFEDYDPAIWREVMSVNIDGMFNVAQCVGRQMVEQGKGGSVIMTSSVYGVVAPDPRIYDGSEYMGVQIGTPAAYSTSKAAVIGLARHLSTYWAKHQIRVNTLTPGGVESGQNGVFQENYSSRVPLGRMANYTDLHGALIYLASDASSYVTGQNLIVDGGMTAW